MTYAIAWIGALIVFLALDFIWLSLMGPQLYHPLIGEIMREKTNLPAAIAFYLIYTAGIVALVVAPALERGDLARAIASGALLGFVAYATYDLTNQATLRVWDVRLTLADMAWGTALTATTAGAAYWLASRFT